MKTLRQSLSAITIGLVLTTSAPATIVGTVDDADNFTLVGPGRTAGNPLNGTTEETGGLTWSGAGTFASGNLVAGDSTGNPNAGLLSMNGDAGVQYGTAAGSSSVYPRGVFAVEFTAVQSSDRIDLWFGGGVGATGGSGGFGMFFFSNDQFGGGANAGHVSFTNLASGPDITGVNLVTGATNTYAAVVNTNAATLSVYLNDNLLGTRTYNAGLAWHSYVGFGADNGPLKFDNFKIGALQTAVVPEPSTLLLCVVGGVLAWRQRRNPKFESRHSLA